MAKYSTYLRLISLAVDNFKDVDTRMLRYAGGGPLKS